MSEPINLADKRRKRHERADEPGQYMCGECGFGLFLLWTDGAVVCGNCGTETDDLRVREVA